MRIETIVCGELQANAYLVFDDATRAAFLVDPGDEPMALIDRLTELRVELQAILLTHGHFDHVDGVGAVRRAFNAPIFLHKADLPLYDHVVEMAELFGFQAESQPPIDRFVEDGDMLELAPFRVDVIHTPGHSPGGACYRPKNSDVVFVGDTLFAGSIGRSDLPGGSTEQLLAAIRAKLLTLDDATILYPGHGPATTVAVERDTNPFLS